MVAAGGEASACSENGLTDARRHGNPIPGIDHTSDQGSGRAIDVENYGDTVDTEDEAAARTN